MPLARESASSSTDSLLPEKRSSTELLGKTAYQDAQEKQAAATAANPNPNPVPLAHYKNLLLSNIQTGRAQFEKYTAD